MGNAAAKHSPASTREATASQRATAAGSLDTRAARALLAMRANVVDAQRVTALKRNVHEIVIDAPAARFAESLGAFKIATAAAAWGAPPWLRGLLDRADRAGILPWLENRLTSDHAELIEMRIDGDTHTMAYRYLAGTPLAGESRYTIAAHADGCRLTVTFAFQETTALAVLLLHGFGIRQHDLAVLAQAETAAHRIGARVVAHTIQSAA